MTKGNIAALIVGIVFFLAVGNFINSLPVKEDSAAASLTETKEKDRPIQKANQVMEIKVRKGWCLSEIAYGLGTTIPDMVEMNSIRNPNIIYAGQTLKVVPYNRSNKARVSWYGPESHGNKMSNGDLFDMYNGEIAAHKFLPFGTKVKLTRIDNKKSIVVVIQDRGPYVKGRHFDISYEAAKALDIVHSGVTTCKVEILN